MSASELIQELESMPPDRPIDWIALSERLNGEFRLASSSQERGAILAVRAKAIELVEHQLQLHGDQLEKFIDVCDLEYKRLIVEEASENSHISYIKMLTITDREIAAGRMSEDFALRQIAKEETGSADDRSAAETTGAGPETRAFDRLKRWLHRDV